VGQAKGADDSQWRQQVYMNLFIDTNIWLSFYHYSADDLEELRKLGVLIDKKTVRLHLPDQVIEEFRRNREAKFIDAIRRFKEEKLNDEFPQLCRQYATEYEQMRQAVVAYKDAKRKLMAQIESHYENEELRADEVIRELFGKANGVIATPEVVSSARVRYDKGNPPGKKGSLGDAINWECLLNTLNKNCDLYFISEDKDYRSSWNEEDFESFLKWEWKTKNGGEVVYFRRLSLFLKAMFPDINLRDEVQKEELIRELDESSSFRQSHDTLDKLVKFTAFTGDQINAILKIVTTNGQVYRISDDWNINDNVRKIIDNHTFDIDPDQYELYKQYYLDVEVKRPGKGK
jgi:hypothetical protein